MGDAGFGPMAAGAARARELRERSERWTAERECERLRNELASEVLVREAHELEIRRMVALSDAWRTDYERLQVEVERLRTIVDLACERHDDPWEQFHDAFNEAVAAEIARRASGDGR